MNPLEARGGHYSENEIDTIIANTMVPSSLADLKRVLRAERKERRALLGKARGQLRALETSFGSPDGRRQSFHTLDRGETKRHALIIQTINGQGDIAHHVIVTDESSHYGDLGSGVAETWLHLRSTEFVIAESSNNFDYVIATTNRRLSDHWDVESLEGCVLLQKYSETFGMFRGAENIKPNVTAPTYIDRDGLQVGTEWLQEFSYDLDELATGVHHHPGITGQFF